MPKPLLRPGSVWDTGRSTPARQVADRHVGATRANTALIPEITRQIITTYTTPGDTVCDPNPGPGLVLAEALRAGRDAIDLPTEPRWESALEANLDLARLAGPIGTATLLDSVDDPAPPTCRAPSTSYARGSATPRPATPAGCWSGCMRTWTPSPTGSGLAGTS